MIQDNDHRPTERLASAASLEERGVKYAIRIPTKDSLEKDIAELLTRPVGRQQPKASGTLVSSEVTQ